MNIYTTPSSAIGIRVERVSLSARPIVTRLDPSYVNVGFDKKIIVEGYNLLGSEKVYLSAGTGVYTNSLSSVSAFDLFASLSGLSALFPAFSGFEVKRSDYVISSQNSISLSVSATQAIGSINIIIKNPGGYTVDSSRTLSISA